MFLFSFGRYLPGNGRRLLLGAMQYVFGVEEESFGHCFVLKTAYNYTCSLYGELYLKTMVRLN